MITENTSSTPAILTAHNTSHVSSLQNSLPILGVLFICLALLLFKLDVYPRIWFDEGYKLNAAYTLATSGLYATYTVNGYVPFDPGTSGGPADILPTALVLKLFGTTVIAARLTSVLYTLLAALSLYQIATYLWGKFAALFCLSVIIAIPPINQVGFILAGRQSLSEATAFSLMIFGIWLLSYAWRTRSMSASIMSGLLMGLGMLSKTQIAIGLVPALLVVAVWRWLHERKDARYWFTPALMVVGVFLGWTFLGQLLTPSDIHQQNSSLLMDAIRTNIITDLFGRNLDTQSLLVIGIMLLGILTSIWRLFQIKTFDNEQWIELLLLAFTGFMLIWFAFFSVGWVRYAYAGMIVGLFLLSRFIWGFVGSLLDKRHQSRLWLVSVVVIAALVVNFRTITSGAVTPDAQRTAQYISTNIPKDAVIETWEWELDMLSGHKQFHHPPQALLFEAIRQVSHHQPFSLNYDALQSNPDYLIIGNFGAWTHIYASDQITKDFSEVATFGIYHIYKRITAP